MADTMQMRVLGHRVEVQSSDPGMWSDTGMGRSSIGACSIQIKSSLPCDAFNSTLLHELLHMIADHSALGLTEQQIASLAAGLYTIMRDNPAVFINIAQGEIASQDLQNTDIFNAVLKG